MRQPILEPTPALVRETLQGQALVSGLSMAESRVKMVSAAICMTAVRVQQTLEASKENTYLMPGSKESEKAIKAFNEAAA